MRVFNKEVKKVRKVVSFIISIVLLFSGIPASFAGQTVLYENGNIKPDSVSFESKDSLDGIKVYPDTSGSSINTAASGAAASVGLTDDRTEGNYAAKVTVGSSTNSNKNFIINLLDLGDDGLATSDFSKITLSVKPAMGAKSLIFYANYISSGGTWAVSPTAVSATYTVGANLESGKWNTISLDLSALGLGHSFNTIQAVVNEKSTWEFDDVQLKRQQAGTLALSGTQDLTSGGSITTTENARLMYYTSGTSDLSKGKVAGLSINAGRNAASTTNGSVQLLSSAGGINANKVASSADGSIIYYVSNNGSKDVVYKYDRSAGTSTALMDFTDALKTYWFISDGMKTYLAPYNATVDAVGASPNGNTAAILKKGARIPSETTSGAIVKTDVIVFNNGASYYRSGTQSAFASTGAIEVKYAYWGVDSFSFVSNSQLIVKEKYYTLNSGTYQATGAVRYKSIILSGDTYTTAVIDETTYLNLLSRQNLSSYNQYFVYKVEADNDTNNYVVNKYGDDRTISCDGNKVKVNYTDTTGTYTSSTAVTLKSQIVGISPMNTDKNFVIVKTKPNTTTTATESSTGNTASTGGSITNSTLTNSGITTTDAISTTTVTGSSIGNTTTDAISSSTDISSTNNLILNGSFENGTTGWSVYNAALIDTAGKKIGNQSIKVTGNYPDNGSIYQTCQLVKGHKYYSSVYVLKSGDLNNNYGSAQVDIIGINPEMDFANLDNTTVPTVNTWYRVSNIVSSSSTGTGTYRMFSVNTASINVDGLVLIDLTEIFGTGNEPSKEWCDEHISYGAIKNYTSATATSSTAIEIQDTSVNTDTSSSTTQSDQQKNDSSTKIYNSGTQSGSENEWRSTDTASTTTSTSTVAKYDWYAIDINKGTAVPLDFDYDNGIITALNQVGTVMEITYVANNTAYTYRYDTLTKKLYNDADGLETMKFNLYLSTKQPDGRYADKKIVSLKSNIKDIWTNRTADAAFVKLQDNSWYMVNAKTGSATELKLNMNNPQVLYVTDDNKIFLYDDNSRYAVYDPTADSLKDIRPADAANDKYFVVDGGRQILYRTTNGSLKAQYLDEVKADSGQYYLISFDGENTWQTYKNGKWQTACKAGGISKAIMQQYGISMSEVNALDASDFEPLYDGNRQIYSVGIAAMLVAGSYYGDQNINSIHWFLDQDSNDNPLYGKKTYFAKAADLSAADARVIDKILIHETGPSDFTGYYFFEQDGEYFHYDENGWQDEDSDSISAMLDDVEGRYIDITQEGMTKQEVMAIPASELTERFINTETSGGAINFRLIYCSRIDDEAIDKYVSTAGTCSGIQCIPDQAIQDHYLASSTARKLNTPISQRIRRRTSWPGYSKDRQGTAMSFTIW